MSGGGSLMNLEELGTIYLGAEINPETTEYITRCLLTYNQYKNSFDYVKFYINSEGGDVHNALAIIDIMNSISIPVHTYAVGSCMSAALYIFMSGAKGFRYIYPNTLFMSHQWYTGFEGKEHDFHSFNEANKVASKQIIALYEKCTGLTQRKIKAKLLNPSDSYFNAQDALEYNIGDMIIDPDLN